MINREPVSQLGKEVFAELKSILADFSDQVTIRKIERQLFIEPNGPDTFSILVEDDGQEITISALRWHTHESTAEQAVACVMWLLTPFSRIVETERRGAFVASHLDRFDPPGQWSLFSEMGLLPGLFGLKRHVVRTAHQQDVVPSPPEFLAEFTAGTLDENGLPVGSRLGSYILKK